MLLIFQKIFIFYFTIQMYVSKQIWLVYINQFKYASLSSLIAAKFKFLLEYIFLNLIHCLKKFRSISSLEVH